MMVDAADGPAQPVDSDEAPSRHVCETRRSLRLIAQSLGMSLASFYEDAARTRDASGTGDGEAQRLSRDSAELLHGFMSLTDPADRQLCIAFVQTMVAKQGC